MRTPNVKFAKEDILFKKACELSKTEPTTRQASKWRNSKGRAYKYRNKAVEAVKDT